MAETELSDVLTPVAVPTLLVWGDSDARSPLAVARQFEASIPDTQLVVIEGAGHVVNLERPKQVNTAVRESAAPTHHTRTDRPNRQPARNTRGHDGRLAAMCGLTVPLMPRVGYSESLTLHAS